MKKQLRLVSIFLLCLLTVGLLAGCGGATSKPAASSAPAVSTSIPEEDISEPEPEVSDTITVGDYTFRYHVASEREIGEMFSQDSLDYFTPSEGQRRIYVLCENITEDAAPLSDDFFTSTLKMNNATLTVDGEDYKVQNMISKTELGVCAFVVYVPDDVAPNAAVVLTYAA